jgi:hypothetical protein
MTGPEIVKFSDAVINAYTSNELTTLLLTLNRRFLDYVTERVPFPDQVRELVAAANSSGWISQFVLAVLNDRSTNQFIRDFLAVHPYWDPTMYPPLTHPADTLRVYGGRSFIGRDVLRANLKRMDRPTGRKVMLVTSGDHRKVGKTYSKELIDFISRNSQPSIMSYVNLDSGTYDPINLAKKIAKDMRLSPTLIPDQTTEQAARSNQDLVSLLTTNVPNPSPIFWIVLDGFRDRVPSEPIQDFIEQLAQSIQSMQEFRLILLNYTACLSPAVSFFIFKDDLKPLTRTELETHFINVHRQKHKANPLPPELNEYLSCMEDAFQNYMQSNPELAGDQLLLNRAVTDVADTIEDDS